MTTPVIRLSPDQLTSGRIPPGTRLKAIDRNEGTRIYRLAEDGEEYDAWWYMHSSEDPARGFAVERFGPGSSTLED